jgi:putative transposase
MSKQDHWISARGCVYNAYYHFVWSTKYRRKILIGSVAEDLRELHQRIAKDRDIKLVEQEIMADHVHLFVNAHPKNAPADIVKVFKGITAKKLFETHPELKDQVKNHLWNPSYYVGTCGDATKDVIERYVEMQKVR